MGDTSNLAQKKRKIAVEDDEEDDPSRTMTVRTATETHDKQDHKHKEDEKKIQKKPDAKAAEDSKKTVKPEVKPKSQPEKSAGGEKKPDKSVESSKNAGKDSKSNPEKKKEETKQASAPAKKQKKVQSESESESDSSDDGSSSGSDSDSSDSDKKKKKSKPAPKKSTPKKPVKTDEKKKTTRSKEDLVYEVLKRWWYCMEDWPPKDYDYQSLLTQKKLRKVDKHWKLQSEEVDGFTNVVEVASYRGIFKSAKGEVYDLRPRDTCPCFETFKSKSVPDLLNLLIIALKNQINALESSENCDPELLKQLKTDLVNAEKSLVKAKNA